MPNIRFDSQSNYHIMLLGWPKLDLSHYTNQANIKHSYQKEQKITQLTAKLLDQTALHGLLDSLRNKNIIILKLECELP